MLINVLRLTGSAALVLALWFLMTLFLIFIGAFISAVILTALAIAGYIPSDPEVALAPLKNNTVLSMIWLCAALVGGLITIKTIRQSLRERSQSIATAVFTIVAGILATS